MQWAQVIADPVLQNLPYKIELNEWGNIVLSPASNQHGFLQAELAGFFKKNKAQGKVITECSVQTTKGVRVADVAWGSAEFFIRNAFATPYQEAPEVCVEIVSPSNTQREMEEKIDLYLAKGAREVWICDDNGNLQFFTHRGQIEPSGLFPTAPAAIHF
jgi:Uma2 family endonuclease